MSFGISAFPRGIFKAKSTLGSLRQRALPRAPCSACEVCPQGCLFLKDRDRIQLVCRGSYRNSLTRCCNRAELLKQQAIATTCNLMACLHVMNVCALAGWLCLLLHSCFPTCSGLSGLAAEHDRGDLGVREYLCWTGNTSLHFGSCCYVKTVS